MLSILFEICSLVVVILNNVVVRGYDFDGHCGGENHPYVGE